jgi:hypothetical protein
MATTARHADHDREPRPKASKLRVIVVGGVLAILGFCVFLGVTGFSAARAEANRTKCNHNMMVMGSAAAEYAADKRTYPYAGGDFGAAISLLRKGDYLSERYRDRDPACPAASGQPSYDGFKAPWPKDKREGLLAWELQSHHESGYRCVIYVSGARALLSKEEFQEALAEHDAEAKKVLEEGPR